MKRPIALQTSPVGDLSRRQRGKSWSGHGFESPPGNPAWWQGCPHSRSWEKPAPRGPHIPKNGFCFHLKGCEPREFVALRHPTPPKQIREHFDSCRLPLLVNIWAFLWHVFGEKSERL